MEAARAWLAGGSVNLPMEIEALVLNHPDFGKVHSWNAEPEVRLPFDSYGEPRNTDLLVSLEDAHGSYIMAVEAKADETFSSTLTGTLKAAEKTKLKNPDSKAIERLEQLSLAIFGCRIEDEPELGKLRYQLLTGSAGALCEAARRNLDRVVFLVHEFETIKTEDRKHKNNANDLNRFVNRLSSGKVAGISRGELVGPFSVPGHPLVSPSIHLFIAKAHVSLRTNGAPATGN